MCLAAGQLWRAGPARQDRTTARGPGGVRAPDEGRDNEEGGEDCDVEEGDRLFFVQASPDSILSPPPANVETEVFFDLGSLSPRRKRKASKEEVEDE